MRQLAWWALVVLLAAGCRHRHGSRHSTSSGPRVTDTRPIDTEESVSQAVQVTATFSDDMDASTISTSSFTLVDGFGAPVAGTVSYNAPTRTATFSPAANLADGTFFTATLSSTIRNLNGKRLNGSYSWTFVTAGPPVVPLILPPKGA